MINCKKCELYYTSCIKSKANGVLICDDFIPCIDWEQRRYEIAKDVVASLAQRHNTMYDNVVNTAIKIADKLIERLKEK